MKTYGGVDPRFLDLGISWRWVVSFTLRPLYPWERATGTHWIGGWMGPRAGLDDVDRDSNPDPSIVWPIASRYTDYAIPAPQHLRLNYFTVITLSGVSQSLGTVATTGLLYQLQMIDDGDCGAIGGMKIGRGKQSTRRKPASAPATNRPSYGAANGWINCLSIFIHLKFASKCWQWPNGGRPEIWPDISRDITKATVRRVGARTEIRTEHKSTATLTCLVTVHFVWA
jgi:hypothetical protein